MILPLGRYVDLFEKQFVDIKRQNIVLGLVQEQTLFFFH